MGEDYPDESYESRLAAFAGEFDELLAKHRLVMVAVPEFRPASVDGTMGVIAQVKFLDNA